MRFLESILSSFSNGSFFENIGFLKGSIRGMLKRRTATEIATLVQLLDKGLSRLFEYVRDPRNLRQNRRNIVSVICALLKAADFSQPIQASTVLHTLRQSTLADSTGISRGKNYQNTYFLEQLNWLILKSTCSNPHMTPEFLERIAHEFHFELHTLPTVSCYEISYPQQFNCNTTQQLRIYLLVCTLLALTPAYYPKLNTPRPKAATYTRSKTILLQNVTHLRSQSQPQQNSKQQQTSNTSTPSTKLKQNNHRTGGTLSTLNTPQANDNNNTFVQSYVDLQQQQQQQNDSKSKDNNHNNSSLINGRPPLVQNQKQKEFLLKVYRMDEFYTSQNSPCCDTNNNNNNRGSCNNDNFPNRVRGVEELAEVRNAADEESNNIIDDIDFPDLRATILQSSDSARKNRYNFTEYDNQNNECALSPPPLLHPSLQDKSQSPLQSPVKTQTSSVNNIPEISQEKRDNFIKQTTNSKGINVYSRQNSSGLSGAIGINSSALLSAQNSANSTTTENNNNNNNNSSAINNSNNTNQNSVSFFQNTILYNLQQKKNASSSSSSLPSHLASTAQQQLQSLAISSKCVQRSLPENSLSNIPGLNSVNTSQFGSLTNKLISNTISTTTQMNSTSSDVKQAQVMSQLIPSNQISKQNEEIQQKIIISASKNANKQSTFKLPNSVGISLPEIDGTLEKLQERQTTMHPKIVENFLQKSLLLLRAKYTQQTSNKIDWMSGCEWFLVQFWASSISKEDFVSKLQPEENSKNNNNSNFMFEMTKRNNKFSAGLIIVELLKESHELCFRSKFFKIVKPEQNTTEEKININLNNYDSYNRQDSQQTYNNISNSIIVREYSDVKHRSTLTRREEIDLNNCGNYEPSNNSSRMEELLKKVIVSLVISQSAAANAFNSIPSSEQALGASLGSSPLGIVTMKSFRLPVGVVFQFLKQTLQLDLSAVSEEWFSQFLELDWRTNAVFPQEKQIFYDPFFLPSLHGSRYFNALSIAQTVFLNNQKGVSKNQNTNNASEIELNFEVNSFKSPILSSQSATLCDQLFGISTPIQSHMVFLFENTLSLDLIPLLTSTYNLPQNLLVPAVKAALQILYNCDDYEEEEKIKLSTSRLIGFIDKIRPEVIAHSIKRSLVDQLEKQALQQKGQSIRNQQYDVNSPRYFKDSREKKNNELMLSKQQQIDDMDHPDNGTKQQQQPQQSKELTPAKIMQDKMLAEFQRKQNMFAQKNKTNKESNSNTTMTISNNNNLAVKETPVNCRDCGDFQCHICGEAYLKRRVILISCFVSTNKDFDIQNSRLLKVPRKNQVHCSGCSHFVHKQCVHSFLRTGNHYERLLKENEFFCCSCLRLSNFFIPFLQQFEKQIAFNYDHDKGDGIQGEGEEEQGRGGGGNNQRKIKERLTVQVEREKRTNKRLEPLRIEQITKDAKRVEIIDNEEDVVEEESSPMKLLKNTPTDILEITAKKHKIIRQKSISTQQVHRPLNPLVLQSVIRTSRCNSQGKKKIVKSKDKGQKHQQQQQNEYEWLRENESNQSGNINNHQGKGSKLKPNDVFCFPSSQLENLENTKNELKHESPMDQLSVTSDKHNLSQNNNNNLPLKHNFQDSLLGEGVIFEERKESTTLCESDKTLTYFFESEVDISYLEDMQLRMSHLGVSYGQFLEWAESILVDQMQEVMRMRNQNRSNDDAENAEQETNNANFNGNSKSNSNQFQPDLSHENFSKSKQFAIMHNLILSTRIWLLVEDRENYHQQYKQLHSQFVHMIQTDMRFIYKIARNNNDLADQNHENVSFIRTIARLCLLFALDPDMFLAISAKFLFRYLLIDIALMRAKEFSELDILPDPMNFLEELQSISLIQSADSRFVSIAHCFYFAFYGPANGTAIRAFLYSIVNVPQKEQSPRNSSSLLQAKPRLFSSQKIEPTAERMTQSVPHNLQLVKSAPTGSIEEANSEPSDGISSSNGSQFRIAKVSSNVLRNASNLKGNAYSTIFLTVSSAFIETVNKDIIDDLFFSSKREVFNRFKNFKNPELLRTQNIPTLPQTFGEFITCYLSAKCSVCKRYPKSISDEQQGYYFCLLCKVNLCSKHNIYPYNKTSPNHHHRHHHSSSNPSAHKSTNPSSNADSIVLSLPDHSDNSHNGTCIFLDFFNANIVIVRDGETFLEKQLILYRDSIGRGPQDNSRWSDEVMLCPSTWKEITDIISKREIDQRCMQIKRVQLDDMLDAEQAALRERARQDENNHISTILIPPQVNTNNLSINQQHNHPQNLGISQLICPDIQFNRTLTSPQIRPTRFFHMNNINSTPNTNNPSSFNSTQALHLNNLPSSQQNFSSHFFTTLNL